MRTPCQWKFLFGRCIYIYVYVCWCKKHRQFFAGIAAYRELSTILHSSWTYMTHSAMPKKKERKKKGFDNYLSDSQKKQAWLIINQNWVTSYLHRHLLCLMNEMFSYSCRYLIACVLVGLLQLIRISVQNIHVVMCFSIDQSHIYYQLIRYSSRTHWRIQGNPLSNTWMVIFFVCLQPPISLCSLGRLS